MATIDPALPKCCELLRKFEAFRANAYPDPATKDDPVKRGDPWTIGYGATGPAIKPGVVWTRAQAEADLAARVAELLAKVRGLVKLQPAPPSDVFAVLGSFAYNVGVGALERSTLLRKLNAGDLRGCAAQFDVWNRANGKVFPGLMIRRAAERKLFEEAFGLPKA